LPPEGTPKPAAHGAARDALDRGFAAIGPGIEAAWSYHCY
jgi:hypothetical protein